MLQYAVGLRQLFLQAIVVGKVGVPQRQLRIYLDGLAERFFGFGITPEGNIDQAKIHVCRGIVRRQLDNLYESRVGAVVLLFSDQRRAQQLVGGGVVRVFLQDGSGRFLALVIIARADVELADAETRVEPAGIDRDSLPQCRESLIPLRGRHVGFGELVIRFRETSVELQRIAVLNAGFLVFALLHEFVAALQVLLLRHFRILRAAGGESDERGNEQ